MNEVDPPSSSAGSGRSVRGMMALGAMGWVFGALFLHMLFTITAMSFRGEEKPSIFVEAFGQVFGYSLILFLMMRRYAPDSSVRAFLAVRHTNIAAYPLAILLGVTIWFPLVWLLNVIIARYPMPESGLADSLAAASPTRWLAVLFIGLIGPIAEEVLCRGAIVRPLLARAVVQSPFSFAPPEATEHAVPLPPGGRPSAYWEVALISAVLFTWLHMQWQLFPVLFVVALALGALRVASGSLIPGVLLHIAFNSTAIVLTIARPELEVIPPAWAAGGLGAAILVGALLAFVLRAGPAARARAAELAFDPRSPSSP
ncbi:MAG: CPBP family intramembrane metalloprotease [Myxococcales bacterium]|nr:CPBP family intramembrane metalloprotease [Myxococcales bacterium]